MALKQRTDNGWTLHSLPEQRWNRSDHNDVGYGNPGSGDTGTLTSYSGAPLRLKASTQFDADIGTLANDALGRLLNISGTGLGVNEGLIASGDSGGPAFINSQMLVSLAILGPFTVDWPTPTSILLPIGVSARLLLGNEWVIISNGLIKVFALITLMRQPLHPRYKK